MNRSGWSQWPAEVKAAYELAARGFAPALEVLRKLAKDGENSIRSGYGTNWRRGAQDALFWLGQAEAT